MNCHDGTFLFGFVTVTFVIFSADFMYLLCGEVVE